MLNMVFIEIKSELGFIEKIHKSVKFGYQIEN